MFKFVKIIINSKSFFEIMKKIQSREHLFEFMTFFEFENNYEFMNIDKLMNIVLITVFFEMLKK